MIYRLYYELQRLSFSSSSTFSNNELVYKKCLFCLKILKLYTRAEFLQNKVSESNGRFCMGSTKAVTYPHHMVCLETNLSMVYVQNSRIQARSGGKPRFHLGWQLELHWKKLWNVSSFAHRNLRSISAAAHRERWPRTGSLPARSSCSFDSRCRFTTRQARKCPSFQRNRESNAQGPQQYLHGTPSILSGWLDVGLYTAGSDSAWLHKGAGSWFAPTGTAEPIKEETTQSICQGMLS